MKPGVGVVALAGFACLGVYLFVSAPPPLPDGSQQAESGCARPVAQLFDSVNAINQAARDVYTKDIVGPGLKAGLKFDENWQEPGVEAGPLPALFLRLTAAKLEAMPLRLGLYLGSDAPINQSNLFDEVQLAQFTALKESREPIFFAQEGFGQIAMYPDIAAVTPCVSCHNDHSDSPKVDWKLNDVMGATTWLYPEDSVGAAQYLEAIEATYHAVELAYGDYLNKVQNFGQPLTPGANWPGAQLRQVPDKAHFMTRVRQEAGPKLATGLLQTLKGAGPCKE